MLIYWVGTRKDKLQRKSAPVSSSEGASAVNCSSSFLFFSCFPVLGWGGCCRMSRARFSLFLISYRLFPFLRIEIKKSGLAMRKQKIERICPNSPIPNTSSSIPSSPLPIHSPSSPATCRGQPGKYLQPVLPRHLSGSAG